MNAPYIALGTSLAVGIILTAIARKVALLAGLVDTPGSEPHKDQARAVPCGGGLAVLLAMAGAIAVAVLVDRALLARPHSNPVSDANWYRLCWLGAGTVVMAAVGLRDDFRPLSPSRKLFLQAVIATVVVLGGDINITLFIPVKAVGVVLSITWLLLVTNAVNLLDNHDGLAGGVAAIACLFLGILCVGNGEEAAASLLFALSGALVGFLLFNFPPATIYLGDTGSMATGFLLGGLCIVPAFYRESGGRALPLTVLAPVFVLAVPLFDTLRVLALRVLARTPLFQADKRHFSHRLRALGFRPREIAGIHYLLALLTGGSAVLLPRVGWQGAFFLLAQLFGTLTLVAILERGVGAGAR